MKIEALVNWMKESKEKACADNKGPIDAPVMLLTNVCDDFNFIVVGEIDEQPMEQLTQLLGKALLVMVDKKQTPKWDSIAYVTEAYGREYEYDAYTMEEIKKAHGKLQKEYETDPLSDVIQCMIITLCKWDGTKQVAMITYGYDDYGFPVFKDTQFFYEDIDGTTNKVIQSFLEFCHKQHEKLEV